MKTRRMRRELAAEIEAHIAERAEELMEAGVGETEARRQARREFGNPTWYAEAGGEAWGWPRLERVARDFRYAARALRASPLFTVTAVLSLALGIGANTAIFTLLHASLWKPLPVPAPWQIFQLRRFAADGPFTGDAGYSYALFQQLSGTAGSQGEIFAKGSFGVRKFGANGASGERVTGEAVSANFFAALGVRPYLGRLFEPQDDSLLGGRRVAVLSYAFWARRFQSDPSVLGKTILYSETPYTVAGVAPPAFTGIDAEASVDLWVPLTTAVEKAWLTDPNVGWLSLLVRLRPGILPARAQALFEKTFRVHVADKLLPGAGAHWGRVLDAQHIVLRPAAAGLATTGRKYQKPLLLLMVLVALVLLISCSNVANLILARNCARQQEIAVRLALGASRWRIVSHLFSESLLLSAAGGACGLALAAWAARLLISFLPEPAVPFAFDLRPGFAVLAFTAAIAMTTAVVFALVPAWRTWRAELGVRSSQRVTRTTFSGRLLVSGQLALSLLLLIGAGLFVRTLRNLNAADLGFRPENVVTFEISFPKGTPEERLRQAYVDIRQRLDSRPEVEAASYGWPGVYDRGGWSGSVEAEGRLTQPGEDNEAGLIAAGPRFFDAIGLRLLQGRYLNAQDQSDQPPVAVVNESFVRYYFGAGPAIGRRIKLGDGPAIKREIVGVVRDARHYGVREKIWRMVYVPARKIEGGSFYIRTHADARSLRGLIQATVAAGDKTAQLEGIHPLEAAIDGMIAQERLTATLCSAFGALALVLAAVGLYGVVAYGVSRRTSEFGLRMALGAQRGDVQRLVLRQTLALVAAGIAAGMATAMALSRIFSAAMAGMLYGLGPGNTAVFAGAAALLAAIALLAAFVPAWRASRIDPMIALRYE